MNYKILVAAVLLFTFAGCRHDHADVEQNGHEHEGHGNEELKSQYTAYSQHFELFAEADAFIAGDTSGILAHFSWLKDFRPLTKGSVTAILTTGTTSSRQKLDTPLRDGIYRFELKSPAAGKATLSFELLSGNTSDVIEIKDITIYANEEQAEKGMANTEVVPVNTTVFTKEQSWKTAFSTGLPTFAPFGQVIKTTALVKPSQGDESILTARGGGVVKLSSGEILPGKDIRAGERLMTITSSGMADNNMSVRYAEAESNLTKAKAGYDRAVELAKDKIVSERELADYRNDYNNAKTIFETLKKNFSPEGQIVTSPISGFIREIFVTNGSFVEAGQPLMTVSQDKSLLLRAELPLKYAGSLAGISSAHIRTMNGTAFTLGELNGKVLSVGKAAGTENYLIPLNLLIENNGHFIPGSFVELFLKAKGGAPVLTVPNTALIEEQGNYFVWVQVNPELFEKRQVKTGITDGLSTEIVSGITPAERIVTEGAMTVKLAQSSGALDAHSGHVH